MITMNTIFVISLVIGLLLFVRSTGAGISDQESAASASLGGVIPATALLLNRLVAHFLKHQK
jgi:preprotein translocase subunit SecG